MSTHTHRTFQLQPQGPYAPYLPQFDYKVSYTPPEKSIKQRVTYYFLRALVVIQSALRLLQSSSPFFEQYSPLLKQLPNMYKMIKLIQDVGDETDQNKVEESRQKENETTVTSKKQNLTAPTLFI